jgi:hypothetical protein
MLELSVVLRLRLMLLAMQPKLAWILPLVVILVIVMVVQHVVTVVMRVEREVEWRLLQQVRARRQRQHENGRGIAQQPRHRCEDRRHATCLPRPHLSSLLYSLELSRTRDVLRDLRLACPVLTSPRPLYGLELSRMRSCWFETKCV